MTIPSNENLLAGEIRVDEISISHLKETAKWAKFLGIVGFLLSILIALLGIFIKYFFSLVYKMNKVGMPVAETGIISIMYVFIGLVYFILSFYLYQFGTKMLRAFDTNDQSIFNDSLLNQKRTYRIIGIITMIYMGILALGVLGVLAIFSLKK